MDADRRAKASAERLKNWMLKTFKNAEVDVVYETPWYAALTITFQRVYDEVAWEKVQDKIRQYAEKDDVPFESDLAEDFRGDLDIAPYIVWRVRVAKTTSVYS